MRSGKEYKPLVHLGKEAAAGVNTPIYFKKKYNLINGFEADFKDGRKNEEYAKRVGLVEFVAGIALLIAGVALILFA